MRAVGWQKMGKNRRSTPRFGYELMNVFEPGADFVCLFPDIHRNNTTLSPVNGKRWLTNVLYPDRRKLR
jgi:hypothetical protein